MAIVETSTGTSGDAPLVLPEQISERLLTAADLAVFPLSLPSGPARYELYSGRLAIMSPPGRRHSRIQGDLLAHFKNHGEWVGLGSAFVEAGLVLGRDPATIVCPDVCFIGRERPVRESAEGYLETMPHIIAEVRSKNDSLGDLQQKAAMYLQAGVDVVWIVDESSQSVIVHQANRDAITLNGNATLTTAGVLPEFKLAVQDLFVPRV
jgi:Uma2 family endonuclease